MLATGWPDRAGAARRRTAPTAKSNEPLREQVWPARIVFNVRPYSRKGLATACHRRRRLDTSTLRLSARCVVAVAARHHAACGRPQLEIVNRVGKKQRDPDRLGGSCNIHLHGRCCRICAIPQLHANPVGRSWCLRALLGRQGSVDGQCQPMVRGTGWRFARAEQPKRYWVSMAWNVLSAVSTNGTDLRL